MLLDDFAPTFILLFLLLLWLALLSNLEQVFSLFCSQNYFILPMQHCQY